MRHPNKNISDIKRLCRLYNEGTVFTAFDTETSSITPATGRIIEIGAVKFTKDEIISSWNMIFNPHQILSPFIVNLTHITQKMVDESDVIDLHLKDFIEFTENSVIVAHNAQFDMNFLNSECERCSLPPVKNKVSDTLKLSRLLFPDFASHKLDFLADQFMIDKGSSHRALDDAKTCMELFNICMIKANSVILKQ